VLSVSDLFEATLLHHSKDRKAVVQAFRKEGLLQPMPATYAGMPYRATIIDHLFVETSLNPSSHLCHLLTDKHITLANDAVFPFHVLVAAASACRRFEQERRVPTFLTSSRAAARAVDFIQSKGFDINAPYPKAFTRRQRRGGKGPLMAWVQRDPTPIQLLEVYMDKSSPPPRILRDLHGIMVSRGAKTSTGRATQRTSAEPQKQRYYVSQWTTPSTYQHIQNARRREFSTVQGLTSQDKRTNRYLAQVFRNTGTRAPVIPRLDTTNTTLPPPLQNTKAATKTPTDVGNYPINRPTYLYRGVHGPQGKEYSLHRMFRDKGYIAFSTKKSVANRFTKAKYGTLMRLRVDNVPHGTPWIWFRDPNKKVSRNTKNTFPSTFPEAEVLLPPGTLRLLRRPPSEPDVWDVEYIPDKQATSLERKPIYRKAAKANNSNNNSATTTTWLSSLFNNNHRKRKR
jgi:hypothetical protein